MPTKCVMDYRQMPEVPNVGQSVFQITLVSVCHCNTHNYSFPKYKHPTSDTCPMGELEARIEYIEKSLGINQPPVGT